VNDEELAAQARAKPEAFAELYRRHVARVYRYHLAHTGNVKDAEDLTSQTFLSALEGIRSYRGMGSFAAWLLGIAQKRKAMFFRSRKPEAEIEALESIPAPERVDQSAEQRITIRNIARALSRISPDRSEVITLIYFGGLSIAEAARSLGKSEASIKMLVSRGLDDLRERSSLKLEMDHER
jgi:RNA polymerase sigma-70 factor (ECF subfamily)